MDQFPTKNPNPVLSVSKDGTVLYSNGTGVPLLREWDVEVGEKLPSNVADFVQRAISWDSPEKMEVKVGKRVYLVTFNPLPEEECVNLYGFDITDQKELEKKLQESEERLHLLSDNLPDSALYQYTHEPDGTVRFLYCSAGIERLNGVSVQDVLRDPGTLHRQIPPYYFKQLVEAEERSARDLTEFEMEIPMRRPDGEMRWMLLHSHPRRLPSGQTIWDGVQIDVTKHKKADEALKESEQRERARSNELAVLLDAAPAAVWITHDPKALQITGNRLSYRWLRIPEGANASKSAPEGERPETFKIFKDGIELQPEEMPVQMSAAGKEIRNYEFDFIYPDNTVRHILGNASPLLDEDGNPTGSISAFIDITERKKVEDALKRANQSLEEKVKERTIELEKAYKYLKESEASLAEAQKMAHLGNWDWNLVTGEVFWSNELYNIFRRSPQESGATYDEFLSYVHPDDRDRVNNALKKGFNGESIAGDYRIILSNGEERVVHSQIIVTFDETNFPVRLRGIIQDITERKKAEKTLESITIIRKKEIHHRIKNNLQVISSLLDLQAEKFNDREYIKDSEVLEAFRESQERVMSIAFIHEELHEGRGDDALNFSLYLQRLLKNLFQTYRFGNIEICLDLDLEDNIFFDMDTAVPLGMIVNELISNSFKYAFPNRDKGEIQIKLLKEEKERNELDSSEECFPEKETRYTLIVSDDGSGIPERIDFENSDTLGIQLVTILVDQLDGKLELNRDTGTKFTIRFTVTEKMISQ